MKPLIEARKSPVGLFAISSDGETYSCDNYPTREEAITEGRAQYPGEIFYVGKISEPSQPETWWSADDWLEHVSVQDEYHGDHAEGWDDCITKEQKAELEAEVQKVMAAWLDRHNARPAFFNIVEAEEILPNEKGHLSQPGASVATTERTESNED